MRLLRKRPSGVLYQFPWWARLLCWLMSSIVVGFCAVFLALLAWLLGSAGGLGWIILAVVALWLSYVLAAALSLYTPVILAEQGFYVRALLWWVEVPWADVVRLHHVPFVYDIVYVRQRLPFRRVLWGPLMLWRDEPITLMSELQGREELFWEIWRRASRAQGREVPVKGTRPPGGD